jgi:hypothetical protein
MFLVKVGSYNSIIAFTSFVHCLRKMPGLVSNCKTPEKAWQCCVKGTLYHRVVKFLLIALRTPSSAHLYVSDNDMVARVNLRCWIMDGLNREIMVTTQPAVSQVNSFVEIFLRACELTRNQEVLNGLLASHEAPVVYLRKQNRPTCNEVAVILLDNNMRAKRDIISHQWGGFRYAPGLRSTPIPFVILTWWTRLVLSSSVSTRRHKP